VKLTPEIIAEWQRELPRLQRITQTGNLPVTSRLCLGAILDVLEEALNEIVRLTPVASDGAGVPAGDVEGDTRPAPEPSR